MAWRAGAALEKGCGMSELDILEQVRSVIAKMFIVDPRKLHVCYAAAENVFAITQTQLGQVVGTLSDKRELLEGGDTLSSGLPIRGVELKIVDPHRVAVADGDLGEVLVKSPFAISEYFGSALPAVDRDGWYATRDLGTIVDGELFVVGRIDDVIVTRGKNSRLARTRRSPRGAEATLDPDPLDGSPE
jgi:acyl-CoA synthetase (AMP-forming)/AMP-acid ligase II